VWECVPRLRLRLPFRYLAITIRISDGSRCSATKSAAQCDNDFPSPGLRPQQINGFNDERNRHWLLNFCSTRIYHGISYLQPNKRPESEAKPMPISETATSALAFVVSIGSNAVELA